MVRQAHNRNSDVIPSVSSDEVYVILKLYEILGREVATIVNEFQNAGSYNYQLPIINYHQEFISIN